MTIDEFKSADIRIGTILSAERIPGLDKIWKLTVDVGEESPRTILTGIIPWYPEAESLTGKQVPILVNLEPRTIKGIESQGMLVAIDDNGGATLVHPDKSVKPGSRLV